jgi:hypothetical protein
MRQILPSGRAEWRSITDDVPDYIPVEFAAPAVEVQPDGLVERIVNDSNTYTYNPNTFTLTTNPPGGGTYTVFNGALNIGSTLSSSSTSIGNTVSYETLVGELVDATQYYTNEVERLRINADGETMMFAEQSVEEEPTIDDSELIEPEPIVKRRVVRRKKEKPMFWKEEAVGERTTLPAVLGTSCANLINIDSIDSRNTCNPSSPFVKMIPMKILTNSFQMSYRHWIGYNNSSRSRSYQRTMITMDDVNRAMDIANLNIGLSQVVNGEIMNGRLNSVASQSFETILKRHTKYFIEDTTLVDVSHTDGSVANFEYTGRAFRNGESMRVNARTFNASLGQLTCFLERERWSRVFIPQVMAVVLPENYVYQKQHILVHGTIDLSKVIVLVNRELDDTDFHNKNFRAYYRKHLLPILNEMKVEVWKVPVSFMEENCFHSGINLEATSFMDKKKEIETIYDDFRNTYDWVNLDSSDDEDDGDDDEYDEDYDDEDDDY